MQPPDLVTLFIAPLNDLGIPYMVTGAVAAVIYGEPRFTRDLDVVVTLDPADADRLAAAFPAADFYVPPSEAIQEESARPEHGRFNLIHHDRAEGRLFTWRGRTRCTPGPWRAACAMTWAAFRSGRHPSRTSSCASSNGTGTAAGPGILDDVRAMLRVSGDDVDREALSGWVTRLGLEDEWRLVSGGTGGL